MTLYPSKFFDPKLLSGKQTTHDIDKNLWQPHDVYAQFFSQDGCTFKLTANYTEEEQTRDNRKNLGKNGQSIKLMRGKFYEQVEKRINEAVNKKAEIRKVNKENAELKRQRRIRERANIDVDFILKNVDKSELWVYENQDMKQRQRQKSMERHTSAKLTRKIDQEYK